MEADHLDEWLFEFGLCVTSEGETISRSKCEELFEVITAWAEKNGYGIGGTFRAFSAEEKADS